MSSIGDREASCPAPRDRSSTSVSKCYYKHGPEEQVRERSESRSEKQVRRPLPSPLS